MEISVKGYVGLSPPVDLLHRLDLGVNPDGCAPEVAEALACRFAGGELRQRLAAYPDRSLACLRDKLSELHGIPPESFLCSAGVEQMIGAVAAAVLRAGDRVLLLQPGFFVFENFSIKQGALPIHLPVQAEDSVSWNGPLFEHFQRLIGSMKPRVVWLASPNNPTGRRIPDFIMQRIFRLTAESDFLLVVDEAYGEYVDPLFGVRSASRQLERLDRLVVMRTFSKAYGLADLRLGYAMCSHPRLRRAIALHLTNFPFSRLAIEAAELALDHMGYLEQTRQNNQRRQATLLALTRLLPRLHCIPSDCNILMLRCEGLSAETFASRLRQEGIASSALSEPASQAAGYIRLTLGREDAMAALAEALRLIASGRSRAEDGLPDAMPRAVSGHGGSS